MSPAITGPPPVSRSTASFRWVTVIWVSLMLVVCYAPLLKGLLVQWYSDPDMGHGFFVPVIAAYIAWLQRARLANLVPHPSWWGLPILLWGAFQLYIGTLGAELYLARTSFVITLVGAVLLLGGREYLRVFAFSLFLLIFMIPIPAIIYNQITFPLQLRASEAAEGAISLLGIPIIREGNVLELAHQKLNVVEACSGIRSLLTLTFLSLAYGYFFEKRTWLRVVLFFATIPIAIIANAGRVTMTGIMAQYKPELADGLAHEAQGWVIFMVALIILIAFHQLVIRICNVTGARYAR